MKSQKKNLKGTKHEAIATIFLFLIQSSDFLEDQKNAGKTKNHSECGLGFFFFFLAPPSPLLKKNVDLTFYFFYIIFITIWWSVPLVFPDASSDVKLPCLINKNNLQQTKQQSFAIKISLSLNFINLSDFAHKRVYLFSHQQPFLVLYLK